MKGFAVIITRKNGTHFFATPAQGFATPVFFRQADAMAHALDLREHKFKVRVVKVEYTEPTIISPKKYVVPTP